MLIFLKKVVVFIIPIVLVLLLPVLVIIFGKEYYIAKDIIDYQNKNPNSLFSFSYNVEPHFVYKTGLIKEKKPDVIIFGTSVVMRIRKIFFNQNIAFVNAGASGTSLKDIDSYVDSISIKDKTRPPLLVIGLDRDMFLKNQELHSYKDGSYLFKVMFLSVSNMRKIYADYFSKKFSLAGLFGLENGHDSIGLSAQFSHFGFTSDGTLTSVVMSNVEKRRTILVHNIEENFRDYSFHKEPLTDSQKIIIDKNVEIVEDILQKCQSKNIKVITFLPPYPEEFFEEMNTRKEGVSFDNYYTSDSLLSSRLSAMSTKYNFSFFNLTDIKKIGGKNTEFVDYIHGTDKLFLRAFIYMYKNSKILDPYADVNSLEKLLSSQPDDYLNF